MALYKNIAEYLTFIPPGCVGYELALIISYLSGINYCFIKNAHKILLDLPDLILLEQTGKDKGLPLFTCHASIKTVNM